MVFNGPQDCDQNQSRRAPFCRSPRLSEVRVVLFYALVDGFTPVLPLFVNYFGIGITLFSTVGFSSPSLLLVLLSRSLLVSFRILQIISFCSFCLFRSNFVFFSRCMPRNMTDNVLGSVTVQFSEDWLSED